MIRRLALMLAILSGPASGEVRFIDRSADLPVAHVYSGGWEHFVGGGVAILDCNGDDFADLFVAGGAGPARLFVNATGVAGAPIRFDVGEAGDVTGVTERRLGKTEQPR